MSNEKIELRNYNNLTKTLGFNAYNFFRVKSSEDKKAAADHIKEYFNPKRLADILRGVSGVIGACILDMSAYNYEPLAASVNCLIAEESHRPDFPNGGLSGHLDKSHIAAHTYPEDDPTSGSFLIRTDMDVSTCGLVSPLAALNYLIGAFEPEIVILDYRVRGFIRGEKEKKFYTDHEIDSIQNFIDKNILDKYFKEDRNLRSANFFHTRMASASIAEKSGGVFESEVMEIFYEK